MVQYSLAFHRLVVKITKENLWLYILKMLMTRQMYAYEINKFFKEKFGFSPALVTFYVVLYKMERQGLIQIGETKSVFGRPDRKYYKITKKGLKNLQKAIHFLEATILKLS